MIGAGFTRPLDKQYYEAIMNNNKVLAEKLKKEGDRIFVRCVLVGTYLFIGLIIYAIFFSLGYFVMLIWDLKKHKEFSKTEKIVISIFSPILLPL